MNRNILYKDDFTLEIQSNALDLIKRVNNLFTALQIPVPIVTSGWRPLAVNMRAGGAKRSLHMNGKAVDLADKDGTVKSAILCHYNLLTEYGLWMEAAASTPSWCHLDTGIRSVRALRVFNP